MVALDCSSYESALGTSAAILSMQPSQLQRAIRDYYQSLSESERGQLCLDSLLEHRFGISRDELPAPPLTDWFHATRAALPILGMSRSPWSIYSL